MPAGPKVSMPADRTWSALVRQYTQGLPRTAAHPLPASPPCLAPTACAAPPLQQLPLMLASTLKPLRHTKWGSHSAPQQKRSHQRRDLLLRSRCTGSGGSWWCTSAAGCSACCHAKHGSRTCTTRVRSSTRQSLQLRSWHTCPLGTWSIHWINRWWCSTRTVTQPEAVRALVHCRGNTSCTAHMIEMLRTRTLL